MASGGQIVVSGAREHNLKGVDVSLPRDSLVVITGLSGSGKSSLAFDTIYAEGQRRYVESLSSYARQFLGQMDKPDVDSIEGLSPAISIDQKTTSRNPRSTVGTVTEIYDYLRLMWARIGKPFCHNCGEPIQGQSIEQITDRVLTLPERTRFMVLAPVVRERKGEYGRMLEEMRQQGYARAVVDGELRRLDEEIVLDKKFKHDISIVIDRLVMKDGVRKRLAESIEAAPRRWPTGSSRSSWSSAASTPDGDDRLRGGRRGAPGGGALRPLGRQARRGARLQREVRLSQLRRLDAGDRAADLLLQLTARRLRALPRARLPAGRRPRPDRARPGALDLRGRALLLDGRRLHVLQAAARDGLRRLRDRPGGRRGRTCPAADKQILLDGTGSERHTISYKNRYGRQRSYRARFEGIAPGSSAATRTPTRRARARRSRS